MLVVGPAMVSQAAITQYNSEAAFEPSIGVDYYRNTFSGYSYGDPLLGGETSVAFSGNGYSYTITAPDDGLYSVANGITANMPTDWLVVTFTGNPVTAVGGLVTSTDILAMPINGSAVQVVVNNGAPVSVPTTTTGQFIGFTSTTPITSIRFRSDVANEGRWAQLENFYVGVVPEPGLVALLAGASLLLLPRKRKESAGGR